MLFSIAVTPNDIEIASSLRVFHIDELGDTASMATSFSNRPLHNKLIPFTVYRIFLHQLPGVFLLYLVYSNIVRNFSNYRYGETMNGAFI